MTQRKVSGMSSHGPSRNYCGTLKMNLKTCDKGTKLRVYTNASSYLRFFFFFFFFCGHAMRNIFDLKNTIVDDIASPLGDLCF